MVSVRTEPLRIQAENLRKEAFRYNYRIAQEETCIAWMKAQEFDEAGELCRALAKQREALIKQKRELLMLAEALHRICDRYDRAEQKIVDSGEARQTAWGNVVAVDLLNIRQWIDAELSVSDQ